MLGSVGSPTRKPTQISPTKKLGLFRHARPERGFYSGTRVLKEASLGASVFEKILFSGLGRGCTGIFFKEASTPGTPIELATSIVVPWEQ